MGDKFDNFDNIFGSFFNENNDKNNGDEKKFSDFLKNMMRDSFMDKKKLEDSIDDNLGNPSKIESYNEGSLFFEVKTWDTPNGKVIQTFVTEDSSLGHLNQLTSKENKKEKKDIALITRNLEKAVREENYELAAQLRDELKK